MSTSQKSPSVPDWIAQIHNNHPHFAAPAVLASELTPETVPRILAQWSQLDSGAKFVVLFAPLLIKKNLQVAYKEPLQQLFAVAVEDSDPWISATAKLLQSYPKQGTFDFHADEIIQLKAAAQDALQGGSLEFYPREHAYYNSQLARQLAPPALRDPRRTNASATFNVNSKSRVSHTDRLEALKRMSLDATTTPKTSVFPGLPSVFRPPSRVSPTGSNFPPTSRPAPRPPPGATPATGLMANRPRPPAAGFLRPSAPRLPGAMVPNRPIARTGVAPPPGRYQRQTRIQLMDMSEANDIDKQRKEALEKKKEDERLEKESRRNQKMREAEERKQREQERKQELKREREERRLQKLKQKEEEVAGRQRKPRGRPKVARVHISDDEQPATQEAGEVDETGDAPITSPTDSSPIRNVHKKRRVMTLSLNDPDEDLPDYEEEREASPTTESTITNQATTGVPSSEVEVVASHPVPSSSPVPPATIIRDFSSYPSNLRPLFDAIFKKCNVLRPADQRLIMGFLASDPNIVPPLEEGRYFRAPIHQEKVFDKTSGNYAMECIDFEIDYRTGEWRQIKRKTTVNE